ncbi:Trigger factor [Labeo rohita]|uniref:Trigger factor n=1 Tax=Labeo rohita TaxID=84645 RepID=A0ABQ8LHJ0_LABRO|nr:Trigger factor [Labeo rohita]
MQKNASNLPSSALHVTIARELCLETRSCSQYQVCPRIAGLFDGCSAQDQQCVWPTFASLPHVHTYSNTFHFTYMPALTPSLQSHTCRGTARRVFFVVGQPSDNTITVTYWFVPKFFLLLLEQGDRSFEEHTRLFLMFANTSSYPDDVLCSFYDASLSTACRVPSSEDGPLEDFSGFVKWTLVRNGSPFTISPMDGLARSTPESSPPSPRCEELKPEPTNEGEPIPAALNKPVQRRVIEWRIDLEAELNLSDQVREPTTVPAAGEQAVDGVSAEWSSAPCTATEGELIIHLGQLD